MSDIILHLSLSVWLTSLSKITSRSIYISANGMVLFPFDGWAIFYCIYIYHIFFIHSSVNGQLGCFHVSAIVNSAALSIGVRGGGEVRVSFQIILFSRYMPHSEITEAYGHSTFSFLRNLHAISKEPQNC